MKFELKKKKLINLTPDQSVIPVALTPQIVGGNAIPPGWVSYQGDPARNTQTGAAESCENRLLP